MLFIKSSSYGHVLFLSACQAFLLLSKDKQPAKLLLYLTQSPCYLWCLSPSLQPWDRLQDHCAPALGKWKLMFKEKLHISHAACKLISPHLSLRKHNLVPGGRDAGTVPESITQRFIGHPAGRCCNNVRSRALRQRETDTAASVMQDCSLLTRSNITNDQQHSWHSAQRAGCPDHYLQHRTWNATNNVTIGRLPARQAPIRIAIYTASISATQHAAWPVLPVPQWTPYLLW